VVGLIEDVSKVLARSFREAGDAVVLLGACTDELGGSEYLKTIHGRVAGRPPRLDLDAEAKVYRCVLEANGAGLLRSATIAPTAGWRSRWPSPASRAKSRASAPNSCCPPRPCARTRCCSAKRLHE